MSSAIGTTMPPALLPARSRVMVPALLALVAMGGAVESETTVTAPTEPAATEESEASLASKLLEREYHRLPPLALQAMARVMTGTLGKDAAESFATDLQAGAWPAVRTTLGALPDADAAKVYDHVLSQLVEHHGQLLPSEVIDLAEVAPGELTEPRLNLLGTVLRNSIALVGTTGSLVARLEAGTAHFGGTDPVHRGRAAALLLAADRVIEAGAFLPPLGAAMAAGDDVTLDLHARFLAATGREHRRPADLLKAWELSLAILQHTDPRPELVEVRTRAVARCLGLLGEVPTASGDAWLRSLYTQRPELGQALFAAVAAQVTGAMEAKSEDQRRSALLSQHRVVTGLLAVDAAQIQRWRTTLDLLSLGWLNEAALVMLDDGDDDPNSELEKYIRDQMKPYLGQIQPSQIPVYRRHFRNQYLQNRSGGNRRNNGNQREHQPLPVADLLASAPTPAWLALLDSSLAQRLRSLVGEFVCRSDDRDRALTLIKDLSTDEPQRASRLARSLVRGFTRSLQTVEDGDEENQKRASASSGIPLTRARQTRNLARLATLLQRINQLHVEPVPPADLVNAFIACHSPAEVFRAEDITTVLGDPQALPAGVLVHLVSGMRSRLADAWRKPSVQQQAGTKRSDAEVVAEVKNGYRVAKTLCAQSLVKNPGAWQLIQVHAALDFDHGEFIYGQQAPLAAYTALRDAAFAGYAKAAHAYVAALTGASAPAGPKSEMKPDVTVYSRWFAAALGASDLSYLSRQQETDGDQVAAVRDAIAALPGPWAPTHRELFAKQVVQSLNEINAELKPRYLRHALRIIGDDPLAAEVKTIVADYDELLGEMQLDLAVDGANAVGHGVPFGARLSLRHTTALGRESGGFAKYLQNQVQSSGGQQVNYRNDVEKHLREALGEHFAVESITFHAADVASHGYGRDGWREMPLAYLVLKAKDPSVDRLPSVHLDLDFTDGHGAVILPVASGVTLIDARSTPPPRVAEVTSVDLTLDDRELDAGTLRLEIRVAGKGLIGGLDSVLGTAVPGFTVTSVDDRGPTVSTLEVESGTVRPLCERLWQVQYAPAAGAIPSSFAFPAVTATGVTVKRQRYHDADLLDATAVESLSPRQPWLVVLQPWLIALAVAVGLGLVGWLWRRRRLAQPPSGPRHVLPERLTPFTVLAVLRAVLADPTSSLDAAGRARLGAVIADLERRSFARDGQAPGERDLDTLAREWVATAST